MEDLTAYVGEANGKKYFDQFREHVRTFIEREEVLLEIRDKKSKLNI